jgi:hypothetical protein
VETRDQSPQICRGDHADRPIEISGDVRFIDGAPIGTIIFSFMNKTFTEFWPVRYKTEICTEYCWRAGEVMPRLSYVRSSMS